MYVKLGFVFPPPSLFHFLVNLNLCIVCLFERCRGELFVEVLGAAWLMADSTYWRGRASSALYASNGALFTLARRHAGSARTLLDVGSYIPDIIKQYSWVPQKTATDTQSTANASAWAAVGIPFVRADFLRRAFPPHDLVTCTQVLEHLDDAVARRFVARLQQATAVAGVLVVSVPLEMPRGWVKGHTQDPLSRAEFASWFAGGGGAVVAHVDVVDKPLRWYLRGRQVQAQYQVLVWQRGASSQGQAPAPPEPWHGMARPLAPRSGWGSVGSTATQWPGSHQASSSAERSALAKTQRQPGALKRHTPETR